jgi:signal-transduction protein with cAMP-binding, CBS, and nucleotidyltransferase domain|tara:strand:+ start:11305 stop:11730 length:426 start_codon:yes stop_codon:yes gene_type:complete
LHQNLLHGLPLFDGLSYDDARRFLKNSTTLVLRGGDRLAKAGDIGDEAFVLLSGNVEIRDRRGAVLASLEKGAIIGKITYLAATPRTADMAGTQNAEVLVLTQETLKKNMPTKPTIANKIMFNLTLILAERLKTTSYQLMD